MIKKLLLIFLLCVGTYHGTDYFCERQLAGPTLSLPNIPKETILSNYRVAIQMINIETKEEISAPIGTAVAIDETHLLTAYHVVAAYGIHLEYNIEMFDMKGHLIKTYTANVIKSDEKVDLALLVVKDKLPYFIKLDYMYNYKKLEVGNWLYSIGALFGSCPLDIKWGMFVMETHEMFPYLGQTSNIVGPGDSGGGVYNPRTNKLIGIISRGDKALLFVTLPVIKDFLLDFPK